MKKTKKDVMDFSKATISLGLGSAIGAGVAAHAPAGTPSLTQGFATTARFMPIAGTAMMGGNVLRLTQKLYKKPKKRKRR